MVYKSSKNGYIYKSYATYLKDGAVVETKEIATSKYNAHDLTYYVWPGYVPGTVLDPAYEIRETEDGGTELVNPSLLLPATDAAIQ